MENKIASTNTIKEVFNFLTNEYGFKIIREESLNYGSYVDYVGNGIKISLGFDFKDYYFYFLIYKGEETEYSDAEYGKSIKSIEDLVLKNCPNYNIEDLQPNYAKGYSEALELNAKLFKRYGDEILSGKDWF